MSMLELWDENEKTDILRDQFNDGLLCISQFLFLSYNIDKNDISTLCTKLNCNLKCYL